jgi:hypothetical protein
MARLSLAAALLVSTAVSLTAQSDRAGRFMDNCRRNRSDNEQFCEVREFSLPSLKGLVVDGRQNGGITVHGWDRGNIQVIAMIQAQSLTEAEASAIARQISIATANGGVAANGPSANRRNESWSVSYEIWAPRGTDLALTAQNGGISVEGIESRMELETVNGGVNLVDVGGDVRGRTVNGGVHAELSGDRWRGTGLDLRTSNGGVDLSIPENYSAQLETGTVNGGLNFNFPIAVRGSLGKTFATQLGNGGALVRLTTTNGGVTLRRR